MPLVKKTAQAMGWVTLIAILTKLLFYVTQIILARILAPADFGVLAIGLLVISTMDLFRDLGFGTTLIYKKDDLKHTAANTAFILLPISASMLFLIAYFSAPYIAMFFDNPPIKPIIQVLALTFIISSFGTVPSMLLEKELEFKKKVIPEIVPIIGYAFVATWLATDGYGVWSLVYGQIVSAILTAGLIWLVSDWRPTFCFDRKIARVLFDYGKHIMSASVLIFIITNIDDAIVGKILGAEALGFYTVAYTISNLPATQITHLISRVMFPIYSKIQDNKNALKDAYMKTLFYVSMLSIPTSIGILIISPTFVPLVLGDKWMPAIPALQILCFYGLFRSIAATTGSIFYSMGKPEILFKTSMIQLIIMIILMPFLVTKFGIIGMSLSVLFPLVIITAIQLYLVGDLLDIKCKNITKVFFVPILSSILMILWFEFESQILFILIEDSALIMIMLILSSIFVYTGSLILFNRNLLNEVKSSILK